jgi:hypothetical protein
MGLVSFISKKATHGGVSGMHVAELDSLAEQVDGDELNRIAEEKLGPGWERIIRETSRQGHEQTLIFIHPEGDKMGLFVLDFEGHEMDVVQVSVDPNRLNESIGHYEHHRQSERDENESD